MYEGETLIFMFVVVLVLSLSLFINTNTNLIIVGDKFHFGLKVALKCSIVSVQKDSSSSSFSFEAAQYIPDDYKEMYTTGLKVTFL